jgi:hypothetical protein
VDGVDWARTHLADRARLGRIVRARNAAEVVANLDSRLTMPHGVADSAAYWSGFAHGVQRVLRETASDPVPGEAAVETRRQRSKQVER